MHWIAVCLFVGQYVCDLFFAKTKKVSHFETVAINFLLKLNTIISGFAIFVVCWQSGPKVELSIFKAFFEN